MKNLVKITNIHLELLNFQFKPAYFKFHFEKHTKNHRRDALNDIPESPTPSTILFDTSVSFESGVDRFTAHFVEIFTKVNFIWLDFSQSRILYHPIWKHLNSADKISVAENVSIEEVEFIFEKAKNDVQITSLKNRMFLYSEGFQQERVIIDNAQWVHIDAILNSKSSSIELTDFLGTTTQMNNLLKLWMSKEKMENLEQFIWRLTHGASSILFFVLVMKGIAHELVEANVFKIQRCDGKVAEIKLKIDEFCFNVQNV